MATHLARTSQAVLVMPDNDVDLIRFEKNLLQIGFFSSHDKRSDSGQPKVLSRRIEHWVHRDGKRIKVSAEFNSSKLGLPSTTDRDKYMAFMKIAMERRLPNQRLENPIRFTGYSLLRALGVATAGDNYAELNLWGTRMTQTTITSEQIIFSSTRKRYMSETLQVFTRFQRIGSSNLDDTGKTESYEVDLADWLLDSINHSYVVPEDFAQYRTLKRPISKGIFVYLNLWFYASMGKPVEKSYTDLCSLLNVTEYHHLSKIKSTIGLSLEELVKIRYLRAWAVEPMMGRQGFKIVMQAGTELLAVINSNRRKQLGTGNSALTESQLILRNALVERGIAEDRAATLSATADLALVQDQIEYFDAELRRDRTNRISNPPGLLIKMIEDRTPVPPTFETSATRKAREHRIDDDAARAFELDAYRQQYEHWRLGQADGIMRDRFPGALLEEQLKTILLTLPAESRKSIQRMPEKARREVLLRALRKEILEEIEVTPFEEWADQNRQGSLYS